MDADGRDRNPIERLNPDGKETGKKKILAKGWLRREPNGRDPHKQ
jgi:hypothetical protein